MQPELLHGQDPDMRTQLLAFFATLVTIAMSVSAQVICEGSNSSSGRSGHFHGTLGPNGLTGHASYGVGQGPWESLFSYSGPLDMEEVPCPGTSREFYGQWELTETEVEGLEIPVGYTPEPGSAPIPVIVTVEITIHANGNVFGRITVFGPGLNPTDPRTRVYLL